MLFNNIFFIFASSPYDSKFLGVGSIILKAIYSTHHFSNNSPKFTLSYFTYTCICLKNSRRTVVYTKLQLKQGYPRPACFQKNLKSWVRLKKNFQYHRKMDRLSRNFILSEAWGILGNICSFEQLFYIKQVVECPFQKLFEYVTTN